MANINKSARWKYRLLLEDIGSDWGSSTFSS
ncbi:unnamed protein product [Onchocerca flexuosa]|uniref:Uncharacterized protein n=1 Tax=Onchocerca flexuosa TaxID=387005 RepID=A0A183HXD0_9BILA|nr:unnamed protein product [Onchocerca flexuosa]